MSPSRRSTTFFLAAALVLAGCFYPPTQKPPSPGSNRLALPTAYDLAWDATLQVLKDNDYRISSQDPVHGIIEAQSHRFDLTEADCGVISSLGGKFPVEPGQDASAVYRFDLKASGLESTDVAVQATFQAPLRVPFHALSNVACASRGVQEATLLKQIEQQSSQTHRPTYKEPGK